MVASRGSGKQIAKYALAADITNSATTLTVGTVIEGTAVDDDAVPFYASIEDSTGDQESVKVVGISTNTWTVIRAQEGTTGVAHSKDDAVQIIQTAGEERFAAAVADNFTLQATIAGAISTGAQAVGQAIVPVDANLVAWSLFLNTANAGTTFISDLEKNGTDCGPILTVADGATVSTRAVATAAIAFAAGDRVRLDVDQVGSGTAGSNLVATFEFERI